jgi:hypothetical protein
MQRACTKAKASPSVAVYVHRDVEAWLSRLAGERKHRADAPRIVADRELIPRWRHAWTAG